MIIVTRNADNVTSSQQKCLKRHCARRCQQKRCQTRWPWAEFSFFISSGSERCVCFCHGVSTTSERGRASISRRCIFFYFLISVTNFFSVFTRQERSYYDSKDKTNGSRRLLCSEFFYGIRDPKTKMTRNTRETLRTTWNSIVDTNKSDCARTKSESVLTIFERSIEFRNFEISLFHKTKVRYKTPQHKTKIYVQAFTTVIVRVNAGVVWYSL